MNNKSQKRSTIFVTVGTQLPFDRLIAAIDSWAGKNAQADIFAQVGDGGMHPFNLKSQARLSMKEFARQAAHADLLISHAGMGSIITALDLGKPIIILPRLALHGEHRNDHQLATAGKFADIEGIHLAVNETDIASCIERVFAAPKLTVENTKAKENFRNLELISMVRQFIVDGDVNQSNVGQPRTTKRDEVRGSYAA